MKIAKDHQYCFPTNRIIEDWNLEFLLENIEIKFVMKLSKYQKHGVDFPFECYIITINIQCK